LEQKMAFSEVKAPVGGKPLHAGILFLTSCFFFQLKMGCTRLHLLQCADNLAAS
jgi:hypothetical protein